MAYLEENLRGVLLVIDMSIGMPLECQIPVRLSDLIYACGGWDAKNLICIPHYPGVHQQPGGIEDD